MNALDRLISVFSPQAGLRRAAARDIAGKAQLCRRPRPAAATRAGPVAAPRPMSRSARRWPPLRNRAREFVRDSWAGQRILDVLVSHVVGTGITVVPNTGSDRADNQFRLVREEWQAQADPKACSTTPTMQGLALRSMVEGGDTVIRLIDLTIAGSGWRRAVPVQGLEGDQIDTSRDYGLGPSNTGSASSLATGQARRPVAARRTSRRHGYRRWFNSVLVPGPGPLPPLPAAALGPGARHQLVRADPAQRQGGAGPVRFDDHPGPHTGLFRRLHEAPAGRPIRSPSRTGRWTPARRRRSPASSRA
jgi:hypothetical protein